MKNTFYKDKKKLRVRAGAVLLAVCMMTVQFGVPVMAEDKVENSQSATEQENLTDVLESDEKQEGQTDILASGDDYSDEDKVYQDGNFEYILDEEKAVVVSFLEDASDIVIPEKLGGYEVKGIKSGALYNSHSSLRKIFIPKCVTELEYNCVYDLFVTIYGYAGSAAIEYAKDLWINYVEVDTFSNVIVKPQHVTAQSYKSVKISWSKIEGADGYSILRKSAGKDYEIIANVNATDSVGYDITDYTDNSVSAGTTYTYAVYAFINIAEYTDQAMYYTTDYDKNGVSVTPVLDVPIFTKVLSKQYNSIQLAWKSVKGAKGYIVYRRISGGKYKKIATVTSGCKYLDNTAKCGTVYYYTVKAYNDTSEGSYNESGIKCKAIPSTPSLNKVKKIKEKVLNVSWKKIEGANGYVIYRRNALTGSNWKKIGTVTKGSTLTFNDNKAVNGVTYYYTVKAYRNVSGKKVYSLRHDIGTEGIDDTYGYEQEPFYNKVKRVFGKSLHVGYSSESKAYANMTSISVKVWDFDYNGNKVTKTKYLSVHKNIAPTVKKIFAQIYRGKEKFPMYSVGGYNWRGNTSTSEHCYGLAIDINPTENYMVSADGTALVGTHWKPSKDAYSIPKNGDVVEAFEKYGFVWGGEWYGKKDYMHFSYLGT